MILWLEKRGSDRRLLDFGHDNSASKSSRKVSRCGQRLFAESGPFRDLTTSRNPIAGTAMASPTMTRFFPCCYDFEVQRNSSPIVLQG